MIAVPAFPVPAFPVPAFPIPAGGALPPGINVLFAIAACAALVVLIVQAVRYFRRRDDD